MMWAHGQDQVEALASYVQNERLASLEVMGQLTEIGGAFQSRQKRSRRTSHDRIW